MDSSGMMMTSGLNDMSGNVKALNTTKSLMITSLVITILIPCIVMWMPAWKSWVFLLALLNIMFLFSAIMVYDNGSSTCIISKWYG